MQGTKRNEKGQFQTGSVGNPIGRKVGSRSKLGEQFLSALQEDWEKNGPETIARVREERPQDYLKVIASILPKDLNININATENMSDEQLLERIRQLDAVVAPFIQRREERLDGDGTRH